jgi:hypothetical protein
MKPWIKWTIIAVSCFVVGLVLAQLFAPSPTHQEAAGGSSILGGGSSATDNITEKESGGFTVIIVAVLIIGAIIGFGYYREKRKK